MPQQLATKLTRVTLDAEHVISTGSIRVNGILASNATASPVTVQFQNNAGTEIITMHVAANDNDSWDVMWIADAGLKIASAGDADVVVTVAHGAVGA